MMEYDSDQVTKLYFNTSFVDDQSERECPACKSIAVPEREIYRRGVAKLLPKLDKLWDEGELPQTFIRVKTPKKRSRK